MNICFRVTKVSTQREIATHTRGGTNAREQNGTVDEVEKTFLKESTAIGLTGLKGHRSVGGIRASNYNSIPLEGAEKLAKFIHDFAKA
jgi:phosphoserine aminotransferase